MPRVAQPTHQRAAGLLRRYLAKYREIEMLLQLGEYKPGGDADADTAIARIQAIQQLLRQDTHEQADFSATRTRLLGVCA
jgi:type III secretion protein N (ATPase)